jgi:serine/threonine-protein kinase
MSEVYRARIGDAIGPERPLVVKIAAQSVSDDPRASARFLDEAKLALALSHGNISSAFEFGKADGRYFIVMEYIRGASVRQLVEAARRDGQRFSVGAALTIATEVARALQYAHTFVHPELGAMPLVHRDVNPSNVLVARDGQVKLTDFGIAHALGRDPSHGVVWGQASYVAPELLAGEAAGPASDLFALGCVLFYMLTLEAPFRGETEADTLRAIRSGATPSARARRPELPAEVDSVLAALLAPSTSARPASAEEARRALEQLRERAAPEHRPSEIASLVQGLLGPEAGPTPSSGARVEALNEPTVPLIAASAGEPFVYRPSAPPEPPLPTMPTQSAAGSRTRTTMVVLGTAVIAVLATAWFLRGPTEQRPRSTRAPQATTASATDTRPVEETTPSDRPAVTPALAIEPRERPSPPSGPGRAKRGSGGPGGQVVAVSNPTAGPPPPSEPAVVTLNSWPWSIASVDGRTLPGHTPLRGVELSPGPHTFRFENPELHMRRVVTVTLASGERRVVSAVLEPEDAPGQHATP